MTDQLHGALTNFEDLSRKADIVIVGAGLAGTRLATNLREGGYAGSIMLIDAESELPYDRTPLSKTYLRGEANKEDLRLHSRDFYLKKNLELVLNTVIVEVNPETRILMTDTGETIGYKTLVWASGGRPRQLLAKGAHLSGIQTLRTMADAEKIRELADINKNAVIVGGGHIGLEIAAAFRQKNLNVTIIELNNRLLSRVTSPVVSDYYRSIHEAAGVRIMFNASVDSFEGTADKVTTVVLDDGTRLSAGVVIVGIGIVPSVDPLKNAGVLCENGVKVNEFGATNIDNIFALGDCAFWPHPYADGKHVRLESVPNVSDQASVIAAKLLEDRAISKPPPWFWSHQYNTKLQTVGLLSEYDDYVVLGSMANNSFTVVYLRNGHLIAADCINRVRDFTAAKKLINDNFQTSVGELSQITYLKELLQTKVV